MFKLAPTKYKINDLLRKRWSPRLFSEKKVDQFHIMMLIEAARWAPSSSNAQPWRFIIFDGSDAQAMNKVHALLTEKNEWAKKAPVLIVALTKTVRDNGEKNHYAEHDLGLATENMLLQATELELAAHPMSGFDKEGFRTEFNIPDEFKVMTILAFGYPGDYQHASEEIRARDMRERKRKEYENISFFNAFEK